MGKYDALLVAAIVMLMALTSLIRWIGRQIFKPEESDE